MRIAISPDSSSLPRVVVDLGPTPVQSFIRFDGMEQGCVSAFAVGADVAEGVDGVEAVVEVVRGRGVEPSTDFLEYMSRCGFVVILREVGL